ncbi:tRNA (pseudouridine(54)-N(1))-methyltransferase TrmY [archaeon]|nr:MAG: tRNA (pseudouridine(54)-N(1))-methyltransferase TrmY [archaeon]
MFLLLKNLQYKNYFINKSIPMFLFLDIVFILHLLAFNSIRILMRTFILYSRGWTKPFSEKDLPGAGRIDIACRCVSAALFVSYTVRRDTRIFISLNGGEKPVALCFDGQIRKISPDERSIGLWISKTLANTFTKEWKRTDNGILYAQKSFEEILEEVKKEKCDFYLLDEEGKNIEETEIKENPAFILGDNAGIPEKEKALAEKFSEKISLGETSYLASSCISVLHWICDRKEK